MKRIPAFVLLQLISIIAFAQPKPVPAGIDVSAVTDSINIFSAVQLYVDSSSLLPVEKAAQQVFVPLSESRFRNNIPADKLGYNFFLKFSLENPSDSAVTAFLLPGSYFNTLSVARLEAGRTTISRTDEGTGYIRLEAAPRKAITVIVQLKPVKNETVRLLPVLIKDSYLENFKLLMPGNRYNQKHFGYVVSGVLLMMILFMATNYILSRRKEFLYNAMYSLCMFLLIFFNSYCMKKPGAFTNLFFSYLDFFLLVTGAVFYISFTRSFLDTRTRYRSLDRILRLGIYFILLLLGVYTYLNFFTSSYPPQLMLENIMKFLILLIGLSFIILAIKQHNHLLNYLAAGNAALVLFSMISLALIWSDLRTRGIFSSSLFYYYLGIVLELFFFLLGLTYKNRSELIERTKEQEALKLEAEKQEFETQIAIITAQQEERDRISADMHDDLGAGMTTIRLYSELAKDKLQDRPIPEIEKISSSANELLNKMNAIIWSMNSSNDSLGNMVAYIRSYALEYFENTGIDCSISIVEDLPNVPVNGEIRRNVFLVVKEALNNILKHSKATKVTITLTRIDDELILQIQDNGIGIAFDKLRPFGNGLKNMKKRMAAMSIGLSIENRNGTLLTLRRKVPGF